MKYSKRLKIAREIEDPYYLKESKLLELYNKCLPPKEAYYYFPPSDEIIIINQKNPKKSFRRIFYNVPYTDLEKQWLQEFKGIINHHKLQLPDYFEDYLLLAFIYDTQCNHEKSFKQLVNYLNFCKKTFPLIITPKSKVRDILNKGFVYVYGRDNRFRPIVICECKIFQKHYKEFAMEEILQSVYFLCQFIVNNMIIPGQFESWIFLLNLKGVSILNMPEPIKKMIPALSNFFIARLYKNYLFGLNWLTRILYLIACAFLDDTTISKVNIIKKIGDPKLFEIIRKDNIEQKFGGTAPNLPIDKEDGFFPPRMPSEHFIKDEENPNDILISEEEYMNRYKNGLIPECCVSPYIYEKLILPKTDIIEDKKNEISTGRIINFSNKKKENREENIQQLETKKLNFIKNERIIKINEIQIRNNIAKEKINNFINDNWNYEEEISLSSFNCFNKLNYIVKDITKFGSKRNEFFSKISSFK